MLDSSFSQLNNFITFKDLFSLSQVINLLKKNPTTVNLLITSKCNLNCSICSAKGLKGESDELSTKQLIAFINAISGLKPVFFIGGGEPFMRRDIMQITSALHRNNIRYGIVTNGLLLNKQSIGELFKTPPAIIIFSLHVHDVQENYSLKTLQRNIAEVLTKRRNTKVLLNCVINRQNYKKLEDIILSAKKTKVDKIRFEHLIYVTQKEHDLHQRAVKKDLLCDAARLTTHIDEINDHAMSEYLSGEVPRLQKKYKNFVIFKPFLKKKEISKWYTDGFVIKRKCFFIKHSIFLKPNGDVIPCQFFADYILGNIKDSNLMEIWKSNRKKTFDQALQKKLLPACMRCCKL